MNTFKEPFIHVCETDQDFQLALDCEFNVYQIVNEKYVPIGPANCNERVFKSRFPKGTELFVDFEGNCALQHFYINSSEIGGGDKLVEIIPDNEISMYDRLRSEMLNMMSDISDKRGDESLEEASDLELDEDDETPLTPYEYQDMAEEYLIENPPTNQETDENPETSLTEEAGQQASTPPETEEV